MGEKDNRIKRKMENKIEKSEYLLKGTEIVILKDPLFYKWHVQLTMVPFEPVL